MCRWRRGLFCITSRSTQPKHGRDARGTGSGGYIDVFGRIGVIGLFLFMFVRRLALRLIAVAAVAGGMKSVGGFNLMLERIAGEAGVFVEVLDAADVLV